MNESTSGYLELVFKVHKSHDLHLRVPTVWDPITNEWRGFIKTPKTQYLIHAAGKDPQELEQNFLREITRLFTCDNDDTALATEVFDMFKAKA